MGLKFHDDKVVPSNGWVYVFAANLGGKLTSPKARIARNNFRVAYGTAEGRSEMAYALPVRDRKMALLPLDFVASAVARFIEHARQRPREEFFITRIGCEEGEFDEREMASLFAACPENCSLPEAWRDHVQALATSTP